MPESLPFLFATGIECSYPTIEGGRWRIDELEATGHYRYWRDDLRLVRDLGLRFLRWGPPYYRVHLGPGRYDWSFPDAVLPHMRLLGIEPILDLCHFGVPTWLENFQNPDFPHYFSEYARAIVRRYPWIRLFTPINEMYVTARMSALLGVWNEQLRDEAAFARAARHLARGAALAIDAIRAERHDARFIVAESSEYFHPCCPDPAIVRIAARNNECRFLPLDLLFGHPVKPGMFEMLRASGMTREEYAWFMNRTPPRDCILGVDYYEWNEHLINAQGEPEALGELFGWYVITQQYYRRYGLPLMHTETNVQDAARAPAWLYRQWHNVELMRCEGIPVVGFTWYSLQDQVDWDCGLARAVGHVNPVGLFDLNRDPRPVADAYRGLLAMFQDRVLPTPLPWLEEPAPPEAVTVAASGGG